MTNQRLNIFFSYATQDEEFKNQLEKHLSPLRRKGIIDILHRNKVTPGKDSKVEIGKYIKSSQVVIVLLSADFLDSDYCYGFELMNVLSQHELGKVKIIPVILRSCDWRNSPVGSLQALPKDLNPVAMHLNEDLILQEIASEIQENVLEIFQVDREGIERLDASCDRTYEARILNHLDSQIRENLRFLKSHEFVELGMKVTCGDQEIGEDVKDEDILNIFYGGNLNRKIAILGQTGSGITVKALTLASKMIHHEKDNFRPLIILWFDLLNWRKGKNIISWLVREIDIVYKVPPA